MKRQVFLMSKPSAEGAQAPLPQRGPSPPIPQTAPAVGPGLFQTRVRTGPEVWGRLSFPATSRDPLENSWWDLQVKWFSSEDKSGGENPLPVEVGFLLACLGWVMVSVFACACKPMCACTKGRACLSGNIYVAPRVYFLVCLGVVHFRIIYARVCVCVCVERLVTRKCVYRYLCLAASLFIRYRRVSVYLLQESLRSAISFSI